VSKLREIEQRLMKECDLAGCFTYHIVPGGKHRKLVLRKGSDVRTVVFSTTPSDIHAVDQAARNVRRYLKEMGYGV
jgi:hypothetical protein